VLKQPRSTTVSDIVQRNKRIISRLESRNFRNESQMYTPVVGCLTSIFAECKEVGELGPATVTNTRGNRFLESLAPDISICRGLVSAATLCAFVEMKLVAPFGNKEYGQCVDYLYRMKRHQPGRKHYVGMMSTIKENVILVLTYTPSHQPRGPDGFSEDFVPQIQSFDGLSFQAALSKLTSFVESAEYNPPQLPFSEGVGELRHVLGAPRRAALGIFPCPPEYEPGKQTVDRGVLMAVKVALRQDGGYENEARILQSFADSNAVPFSVPLLVHNSPEYREIGIMPVGQSFRMRQLDTQSDARLCLKDILSALQWIHSQGIVHRDVRLDNFIFVPKSTLMVGEKTYDAPGSDRPRAVLIDFDRATELGKETCFEGGYICCPPRLLERIANVSSELSLATLNLTGDVTSPTAKQCSLSSQTYRPLKSDDFLSFVLLVLTLLVPHCFETFDYSRIEHAKSDEFKRLRALWRELRSSKIWSPIVEAAESEDVEQLEKIIDVFVML